MPADRPPDALVERARVALTPRFHDTRGEDLCEGVTFADLVADVAAFAWEEFAPFVAAVEAREAWKAASEDGEHTDMPCLFCERMKPFEEERELAYRRAVEAMLRLRGGERP